MKKASMDTSFKYQLLVSDIDGTIMDRNYYISSQTKEAIRSLVTQGIGVTLATGRNYWEALRIVRELQIELPAILANGAQIYDFVQERLLWAADLEISTLMDFLHTINGAEDTLVYWFDGTQWLDRPLLEFLNSKQNYVVKRFILERPIQLPKLVDHESFPFWIFRDGEKRYELTPKSASKAIGLEKLCTLLQLGLDQVVALGNDLNDLQMLERAGVGLGVSCGNPAIYTYADGIVAPMEESPMVGIAQWMLGKLPWERIVISQ